MCNIDNSEQLLYSIAYISQLVIKRESLCLQLGVAFWTRLLCKTLMIITPGQGLPPRLASPSKVLRLLSSHYSHYLLPGRAL